MALRYSLRRALSCAMFFRHMPSPTTFDGAIPLPFLRFSTVSSGDALIPGALLRPFSMTSIRADAERSKKSGSAVKRTRQAEERRIRNKSCKTLIKINMKKTLILEGYTNLSHPVSWRTTSTYAKMEETNEQHYEGHVES
ncbi:hypothetical protein KI387_025366, partial [Taxus chinensis]